MNNKELKVIREAAKMFIPKCIVTLVDIIPNSVKIELPILDATGTPMYMFIIKRQGSRRFSLIIPIDSIGIIPVDNTLALLQALLRTYNLQLANKVIMEENYKTSLHKRIGAMAQALIGIDGVKRMWEAVYNGRLNVTGTDPRPESNVTVNSQPGGGPGL